MTSHHNVLIADPDKKFALTLQKALERLNQESGDSPGTIFVTTSKNLIDQMTRSDIKLVFIDSVFLAGNQDLFSGFFNQNKLCSLILLIPDVSSVQIKNTITLLSLQKEWKYQNFILKTNCSEYSLLELLRLIIFPIKNV